MELEAARVLLHSILQANLVGAPKGKALANKNLTPTPSSPDMVMTVTYTGLGNASLGAPVAVRDASHIPDPNLSGI